MRRSFSLRLLYRSAGARASSLRYGSLLSSSSLTAHSLPFSTIINTLRNTHTVGGGDNNEGSEKKSNSNAQQPIGCSSTVDDAPAATAATATKPLSLGVVYQGTDQYTILDCRELGEEEAGSSSLDDRSLMRASMKRPMLSKTQTLRQRIRRIGMPKGYPQSVRPGYRRFFQLLALNGMIASFSVQLGTQSLLSGFFTGSSAGSWMFKDLAPTLLSAAIANHITTYGSRAKLWYLLAAALSQLANVVEFCIPHVLHPSNYLFAAIVTSLFKGSSGLMFGITRANFLQHYARTQNLGEVTKTIVSIGMLIWTVFGAAGLAFTKYVPDPRIHFAIVVSAACICTVLPYLAVKPVAFRNLTPITTKLILWDYIAAGGRSIPTIDEMASELGLLGEANQEKRPSSKFLFGMIAINPKFSEVEVEFTRWEEGVRRTQELLRQSALRRSGQDDGGEEPVLVHGSGTASADNAVGEDGTEEKKNIPKLPFVILALPVHKPKRYSLFKRQSSWDKKNHFHHRGNGERIVIWFERDARLVHVLHGLLLCLAVVGKAAPSLLDTRSPLHRTSNSSAKETASDSLSDAALALLQHGRLSGHEHGDGRCFDVDEDLLGTSDGACSRQDRQRTNNKKPHDVGDNNDEEEEEPSLSSALEEQLTPANVAYWQREAERLLAMLDANDWDVASHSIDAIGRRFSFAPPPRLKAGTATGGKR